MAPRPTDLTGADELYLKSCLANYRATPAAEKEAFRQSCVKHILTTRSIEENVYVAELFHGKVRNWLQNHSQKSKQARLPFRINQGFSAQRAFALKNEDLIRKTVNRADENDSEASESEPEKEERAYLVNWNATVRQLWEALPVDEKVVYERVAQKWTEEGPEEGVKPLLAEKRAPSWMRSVAHLFWTQCNMPIFIYGMYKDKDGGLHAAVYDTSNLWREQDKSTPQLRNMPGWDQDFRRTVWNFFQATLRPDLAQAEQLQVMHATRRQPPAPVHFEYYEDGCPILVDESDLSGYTNSRRQNQFREYVNIHYNLAVGRKTRSAPWGSLNECPENFFEADMLPEGFTFYDPSKINEDDLLKFVKHVIAMEHPSDNNGNPVRFRFYQFETGKGKNRVYHPAVYSGTVEPAPPRRTKKGVTVPDFEGPPPPSDDASSAGVSHTASPVPETAAPLQSLAATLSADIDAIRAEIEVAKAAENAAPPAKVPSRKVPAKSRQNLRTKGRSQSHSATPVDVRDSTAAEASTSTDGVTVAGQDLPIALSRTRRDVSNPCEQTGTFASPWETAEIDAAHAFSDESSLTDEDAYEPAAEDEGEDSDDEVEGCLNFDLAHEVEDLAYLTDDLAPEASSCADHKSAQQHLPQAPTERDNRSTAADAATAIDVELPAGGAAISPLGAPEAALIAPSTIAANAAARVAFLKSLAVDAEYVTLLARMKHHIDIVVNVPGQNPVFWANWGNKSAHLPQAVHTNANKCTSLRRWIDKERQIEGTSVDVQRVCLGMGMILRDLAAISSSERSDANTNLPVFMTRTHLVAGDRAKVLSACAVAFTVLANSPAAQTKKGKGRATARLPAGSRNDDGHAAVAELPPAPAQRRSARTAARGN